METQMTLARAAKWSKAVSFPVEKFIGTELDNFNPIPFSKWPNDDDFNIQGGQ
jgi:hypothetical protein